MQWIALQGRRDKLTLVIVKMMGKVCLEMWMMGCIVPTKQRDVVTKQLIGIASVTRIVVELDLKNQRRGHCRPHFGPESISPTSF